VTIQSNTVPAAPGAFMLMTAVVRIWFGSP
jgi:hypothetical protein